MSAHAIATAIEEEANAFCRRRFRDQEEYLEAKDSHCKRIARLVRDLRPMIGLPEQLTISTGRRQFGRMSFDVVARTRTPKRSASPAR